MPEDSFDKKITEQFDKATVKQAEKLIDSSPELRAARNVKDGFKPTSGITIGGGDPKYAEGWERIFGNKNEGKKTES